MQEKVKSALRGIIHPETQQNIVDSGVVEQVNAREDKITVVLCFPKSRDPFAVRIKSLVGQILKEQFPAAAENITVVIKEGTPRAPQPKRESTTVKVGKIIAVASGKGGVGKSTVTANLALTLRNMGFRVGVLDADIYGPSQPKLFGVEDYAPWAEKVDGLDYIVPAESRGIKINSIGFYIGASDALVWRGPMATNALKQLINQTLWGVLDFLLIDLPPGTGDVQIALTEALSIEGALIVSTPQQVATADVVRGMKMFQAEGINIPILGIVENMAWFTPAELPNNRYYIFGRGGARIMAENEGVDFLGEIPLIQSIAENSDNGTPVALDTNEAEGYYAAICRKVVEKLTK